MSKPSCSFRSLLTPSSLRLSLGDCRWLRPVSLPKETCQTTVRVCFAFRERIFNCYCDAERRETLRYILERVIAPIGAECRHDLRLELLYLHRMYGPDTPLVFTRPLSQMPAQAPEIPSGVERQPPTWRSRHRCMHAYFRDARRRRRREAQRRL